MESAAMKTQSALFCFLIAVAGAAYSQVPAPPTAELSSPTIADGEYVGLEPMASEDPHEPDAQWFHENTIVVRKGDFILDESPVSIRDGAKEYSASDGGFMAYRGRFLTIKGKLYSSLRPFMSDYIAFPIGPRSCEPYSRIDIYPVKVTEKGFWISGVFYSKHVVDADQLKALESSLKANRSNMTGNIRTKEAGICQRVSQTT
jgi:hypothetical protein